MKRSGFTLIELLVVVIILGILASLAIPRYLGARNKARAQEAVLQIGVLAQDIKAALDQGNTVANLTSVGYTSDPWDPALEAPAGESHFTYSYTPSAVPANGGTITATVKAVPPTGWPAAGLIITLDLTTTPDTWGGDFPGGPTGQLV